MITRYHHNKLTWIDLEEPTADDISVIIKEYGIDPAWAEELLVPTDRAKTESTGKAFFAALHYPDHPSHMRDLEDLEIDYIVTQDLLITAHYAPVDTFVEIAKQFEVASALDTLDVHNGGELFLMLNNELYRGLREELEPLRKEGRRIESEIFQGNEFVMVKEISHLGRRLLDFRQALRSHKIILRSLELQSPQLFPNTRIEEDRIYREYFRVENAMENIRETLKELRDTNDSLLTAKNNDVTKRLTLMAFVTFPLTLVATVLLGHNAPALFQGHQGFWIIVAILIGLFGCMHAYFTYKKWI